jgi:4-hydroxybenzoate polyprenyltransferase
MKTAAYSIMQPSFWRAYWTTMRPYLLFVSAAAGMVGFADGPRGSIFTTAVVFIVFFLSYGFGQALTDCFQMDTDSLSSPYRPLIRGEISRGQVMTVSLTGLGLCCLVLFRLNPWTAAAGTACVAGLSTYTPFKRKWWAGPFYNAWIVALLPMMGKMAALAEGFNWHRLAGEGRLVPIMAGVFFSYANFVLMGYFKDVSADRASGYRTFIVKFGWKKAAIVCDFLAFLSLASTAWMIQFPSKGNWIIHFSSAERSPGPSWLIPAIFYLGAAVLLAAGQIGIHRACDEKAAHGPIANTVRGFLLLRLSETVRLRPEWFFPSILLILLFERILAVRPERSQI